MYNFTVYLTLTFCFKHTSSLTGDSKNFQLFSKIYFKRLHFI